MSVIERRVSRLIAAGLLGAVINGAGATVSQAATSSQDLCSPRIKILAQVNLFPAHRTSNARGIAIILTKRSSACISIVAQRLRPNTKHNAYAVWLYSTPKDLRLLGFVNPAVGQDGRLHTEGLLPRHWRRFHQLIISLETNVKTRRPHHIVLSGNLHTQGFTG